MAPEVGAMRKLAFLLAFAALAPAQEGEGCGEGEAAAGGLEALGGLDWKAKPIDFKKVDRTIRKLPELKSAKPLYGLFLFGVDGETRVWAVLDASAKDKEGYDVLYLDRNADGDLTGEAEKFAGQVLLGHAESEPPVTFTIGDFTEPGSDVVHKGFTVTWMKSSIRYQMKWAGGPVTMGCFGPTSESYVHFGPSPKEAPIFVPGTERPFEFEHWMSGTLARGGVTDFKVFIGNKGDRTGAFTCVDDKFLKAKERVLVQLVCRDAAGKEQRLTAELTERC
jgi:hypothetical protein